MPNRRTFIYFLLPFFCTPIFAQIKGVVTDSITNEPILYASVYYAGTEIGTSSGLDGSFTVSYHPEHKALTISAVGYVTEVIPITAQMARTLNIRLKPNDTMLSEVVVRPRRERYSRRNNPAVDFMRNVIAHKQHFELEENDYYRYDKYQKMKTSLNDMTREKLKRGAYKNIPFLEQYLEPSPRQDDTTFILPISIQETASEVLYRKRPESKKTVITGMLSNGIDELMSTGDMLGTILDDVFKTVNIHNNSIDLMHSRFVSPIADEAISFYHFFLMDTIYVDTDLCVHLTFVPANSQDFGFTGHLYVVNDSSYAVKRCTMNLPRRTGVNYVNRLSLAQEFEQLPNGKWVVTDDDMSVELYLAKQLQGVLVERTTKYSNYSFEPFESPAFRAKGETIKQTDILIKSDEFWAQARQVPLTKTESRMDLFINQLTQIPGFRMVVFWLKALIENHIETGTPPDKPSKFDFGPINTAITSNAVDGLRLRVSGKTTAKLNPNWFLNGYGAYGFRDKKWKYEGELTYAFHKQEFFPWEFPRNYLSFTHRYDVMSPMDKFLTTDKDNVFVALKATSDDQMSYIRESVLKYEVENNAGVGFEVSAKLRNDTPAGKLQYLRNDADETLVPDI
ncbi:MAG: DUF5686 and carboxypeptidase regulatory-like domain-containing protein, partial [Prevotellaceae bacterium]|nr:DUF5686 and carboxypeptidase regulatory-like domain-containing protein [Prevotellaceae bacterium]